MCTSNIQEQDFIWIKVVSRASRDRCVTCDVTQTGYHGKVYTTAAPERGKANERVIKIVSAWLSVAPSDITIVKGERSNYKQLRVSGGSRN